MFSYDNWYLPLCPFCWKWSIAAHHINPGRISVRWPRTYPTSISFRQRIIWHTRWINTSIGSKANTRKHILSSKLSIGTAWTRETSGEALAIGASDSHASRVWRLEEFSLCCPLLAWLFFTGEKGDLRRRAGASMEGLGAGMETAVCVEECGSVWRSIGGLDSVGGWKILLFFLYTSVFAVSYVS